MKKTYIEIIDETIEYYKNNPRSIDIANEVCLYNGQNGERCAFSRLCKEDVEFIEGASAITNIEALGIGIVKEEYRMKDISFYEDLQELHDTDECWKVVNSQNTLSAQGEKYVNYLKGQYGK